MSDESFVEMCLAVAMEFKLLGMENITKIKTRYYRKGLRSAFGFFAIIWSSMARVWIRPESQ